jgi:WD40 repeat protein
MDLESRNASLLSELSSSSRPSASSSSSAGPFLPRAPARHTLTSHRAPITKVAFHPTWTVLASASEDATVKIWDWESGDFERTVKGHTKAVMDVDFDNKGAFMGECARWAIVMGGLEAGSRCATWLGWLWISATWLSVQHATSPRDVDRELEASGRQRERVKTSRSSGFRVPRCTQATHRQKPRTHTQ